ncbi:MAG: 2-dehydropantoate 2-reductase [Ignavibacteriales bacterium]|nr:2-dehydropantoate 2-reductase [Ignavibacteriales bacterium]
MRIAIIGTGGVGGYLGAKLWKSGNDVTFIARGEHLIAMQQNGLRLESPEGSINVKSTFTNILTGFVPFDLIIIGVKSLDTKEAAKLALPVLHDNTIVLSIQNGVENESILADSLGKKYIIPGVAYIISTIASPGVILHEGGTGKFKFGESNSLVSDRCMLLKHLFDNAGINGEPTDNIEKALWWKWIFICGIGGMTAFTKKPIGDILADTALTSMLKDVVHEAATIGRAKRMDEFTDIEEKVFAHYQRLPFATTSSMYYDVTHGKRVEVEALNGAAVRFGKELQISTPQNEIIYISLKQLSQSSS